MLGRTLIVANSLSAHPAGLFILNTLVVCCFVAVPATAAQEQIEVNQGRTYRYDQWDVFTEEPLTGNQLAVFPEPQGLTKALMQSIAREMAFSETAFIFPPVDKSGDFRVRIFGPNREFPFAGHPTIGTAFALARLGSISPGTERVVFIEGIGPIIVELEWNGDKLHFAWLHDVAPNFGNIIEDINAVAIALGIEPAELESTILPMQEVSGRASFLFVPVKSREAVDRAALNKTAMSAVFEKANLRKQSVFLFSTESSTDAATAYGRKLGLDGREDPATGSAAGPLGGYLFRYSVVPSRKAERILIRQGVQMGRPSWLHVQLSLNGNEISDVRVGGSSVFAGDGTIIVPNK